MPSLKDLKVRINSVKSTRKITSAMKMVAAAKLRRAQERAEAGRPYADRMERMLHAVGAGMKDRPGAPDLLIGNGRDHKHLLVVITSDRGLCGAFNSSIARRARDMARQLTSEGKEVSMLCVGRKGRDILRREFKDQIVGTVEGIGKPHVTFHEAERVATRARNAFRADQADVVTLIYNTFKSAISQEVTELQLIPFSLEPAEGVADGAAPASLNGAVYDFEPEEEKILLDLLPRNLSTQVYRALLESSASEHGARMSAMDNATRNAGDMIGRLTQQYNRSRQAAITKELIEIISGAEAV